MPVGISCGRELVSWSLFHLAVPLRRILGGRFYLSSALSLPATLDVENHFRHCRAGLLFGLGGWGLLWRFVFSRADLWRSAAQLKFKLC